MIGTLGKPRARRPDIRVRPLLVLWHRWFGILAALWLALMGITGSAITYYDELDVFLNRDLRRVEVQERRTPEAEWFAAAAAAYPGRYIRTANLPEAPAESVWLLMPPRPGIEGHAIGVFVDPYTAEIIGERALDVVSFDRRHVMNLLYELHMDLLLGPKMLWFLGLVSLFWILDHVVSAILSFPTARKWVQSFRIRLGSKGHKLTFDLHRAGGLWFWPVTLMLAVSGLYFTWYEPFVHVVDRISPVTERAIFTLPEKDEPVFDPVVSFDTALTIASQTPGTPIADLVTYSPWVGAYEVKAFDPRDIDPYGRRLITISADNGRVINDRHQAEGSTGDVFIAWQYPIHSGKAFGPVGRFVIFLSGVVLTVLCVTGLLIWIKKRRVRTKKLRKPMSA